MAYLIAILSALALFVGFLVLTVVEKRTGKRLLGGARRALDARASGLAASARSADPFAYVIRGAHVIASHIVHDIANVLWGAVRMLERTLAGSVRKLRAMRQHPERTESNSGFVKSISYFKRTLRTPEKPSETMTPEEVV